MAAPGIPTFEADVEFLFETREEASVAAAAHLAKRLTARLNGAGRTSLVVSGGTTPARCLAELSEVALDWNKVHVLLSDERWVPPDHADSNEKLVRESLLIHFAREARLVPVFDADTEISRRSVALGEEIRRLPFPFACALLGMGEDGHFASLFPDAENLQQGLETDSQLLCMPVTTAASEHPRVSLTLAALSRSDEVVLLIFGDRKREVYEQARQKGSELPVARLLKQKRTPVNVYWAP